MPEVTKITVTFDDGTEHVVFQVAKVVEAPASPAAPSQALSQLERVRIALEEVRERLPGSNPVPVPPMPASGSVAEYTASLFDHYAQDFLFRNVDSTPLPKSDFEPFAAWVNDYLTMLKDPTYWNNIRSQEIPLDEVQEEAWANFEYGFDQAAIDRVKGAHGANAKCHAFSIGRDNDRLDEMNSRLNKLHAKHLSSNVEFEWIPDYCLTVILDPTKTIPLLWTIHED